MSNAWRRSTIHADATQRHVHWVHCPAIERAPAIAKGRRGKRGGGGAAHTLGCQIRLTVIKYKPRRLLLSCCRRFQLCRTRQQKTKRTYTRTGKQANTHRHTHTHILDKHSSCLAKRSNLRSAERGGCQESLALTQRGLFTAHVQQHRHLNPQPCALTGGPCSGGAKQSSPSLPAACHS